MTLPLSSLSLWELAHRLHDADPDHSTSDSIPLPVQDSLRTLAYDTFHHVIRVSNTDGIEFHNSDDVMSLDEFKKSWDDQPGNAPEDSRENPGLRQAYSDYCEQVCEKHNALVTGLDRVFKHREYPVEQLESIHLSRESFSDFCQLRNIDLPDFWFSEVDKNRLIDNTENPALPDTKPESKAEDSSEILPVSSGKKPVRTSQIDKQLCQAIARTLWHDNPNLTIKEICNHHAIQFFGNGRLYSGKNTLPDWISEVDPRPAEQKRGRPKKLSE